jgi:hypothetical protein
MALLRQFPHFAVYPLEVVQNSVIPIVRISFLVC